MTWRPVLRGGDADRARALVAAIVDELATRAPSGPTLSHGHAGIALLHAYRARAGETATGEAAFDCLAQALDGIAEIPQPWLFHGHAGIAFALAHLPEVAGDVEDVLAQLDGLIAQPLAEARWPYEWELMFGAIGLGVYGLERGASAIVARVVHHLGARAEHEGERVTWRAFDPGDPEGYFNLGIAHGVAGAIAFLAAAIATPGARDLLPGAVAWLRARERPGAVPAYPMTEARRVELLTATVDGWCYGDPSTALAYVRAGAAADEPAWRAAGHALAIRAARRTDGELAAIGIDDALCHGAIGRAHLFHRLGLALADDELLACAARWYDRALTTVLSRVAVCGLQTGLAGIGLGLLAGYSAIEPAWDRALLLG